MTFDKKRFREDRKVNKNNNDDLREKEVKKNRDKRKVNCQKNS